MSFFNFFKRKIQQVVVFPKTEGTRFRKGMWVVVGNKVGIYTQHDGQKAFVDFVGDDGLTYSSGKFFLAEIRQARISEVPACRNAGLELLDYQE